MLGTSSFFTVWSRSLISRDLFETRGETLAHSPTAWSSTFWKAETSPPFLRTRRTSSFLVLRIGRASRPASHSFLAFPFFLLLFFLILFYQLPFPSFFRGLAPGGFSMRGRQAALPAWHTTSAERSSHQPRLLMGRERHYSGRGTPSRAPYGSYQFDCS